MKYIKGSNGYALYLHKGVWRESASTRNEEVDRLNKESDYERQSTTNTK